MESTFPSDRGIGGGKGHPRTDIGRLNHRLHLLKGLVGQLSYCPTRGWSRELVSRRSARLDCGIVSTSQSLSSLTESQRGGGYLLRGRMRGNLAPNGLCAGNQ